MPKLYAWNYTDGRKIDAVRAVRRVRSALYDSPSERTLRVCKDIVDAIALTPGTPVEVADCESSPDSAPTHLAVLEAGGIEAMIADDIGEVWEEIGGKPDIQLPNLVDNDEEQPALGPSYEACKVALILLAHTAGNVGVAVSAAAHLAKVLGEFESEHASVHDEAHTVLLDTFAQESG